MILPLNHKSQLAILGVQYVTFLSPRFTWLLDFCSDTRIEGFSWIYVCFLYIRRPSADDILQQRESYENVNSDTLNNHNSLAVWDLFWFVLILLPVTEFSKNLPYLLEFRLELIQYHQCFSDFSLAETSM